MSVPKIRYTFFVLTCYYLVSLSIAELGNREKPKELLRHQQNHRPLFIDRRLTFESRIQRYAVPEEREIINVESSSDSHQYIEEEHENDDFGVIEPDDDNINDNVKMKNFNYKTETIRSEEPETNIEKPATQIRHGRSRGHFARPLTKVDELDSEIEGTSSFLRIKNDFRESSNLQYVETNDTIYLDFDFDENNSTGNIPIETNKNSSDYHEKIDKPLSIDENRRFGKLSKERSSLDSTGRIITNDNLESDSTENKRLDSFGKLRKVVIDARSRVKEREGIIDRMNNNENSTGNREFIGVGDYGTLVHSIQDDRRFDETLDKSIHEDLTGYGNNNDEEDDNHDRRIGGSFYDNRNSSFPIIEDYSEDYTDNNQVSTEHDTKRPEKQQSVQVDIVTRFLRIIENQHLLGENCTAGTDLNLGEGVVDQYAQERFRLEANLAVNRANMLTRLWKYAPEVMLSSEYLLHASILSMVEFDEDIFAAGNCYDKNQYGERWLYCPFAHRLQDQDGVLVKDLAIEYKYLSNSSEWFYIARKNAERVIASNSQYSHGYHTYTHNESTHTGRVEDEILTVKYEDGRWSKPYYDCGGGNIWMLTYTVPFFGFVNDTYFFKGTSGIDIDLRRVDIDQCPLPPESTQLNIFAASDKCKNRTTECVAIPGLGFRRGSYRCVCKRGYYYPDTKSTERYYNGTVIEEEFEKLMLAEDSQYGEDGVFECLPCAEGCEYCEDGSPCVVSLNWLMRTAILILECCIIACLPAVILFTWKFGNVKLDKNIEFGERVTKLNLPSGEPELNKSYFAAGWGKNAKDTSEFQFDLKVLEVQLADERDCQRRGSVLKGPAALCGYNEQGNTCSVVRAASPVLLRVIVLGAFFIYCTTIVMYPRPNVVTCTIRVWLREIGFSLTYGALMLKTWRISVIFRVKSAKAVKITDMNLLKRLGIIVTIFAVFLGIRTLVAPPVVIVARTADDLKAYLCRTDWWDHSFTTLEVMFLIWGIRLCIVVRKAPSEFNESRFISMAIYNEFLLSVFLNVSMLFLQSPANPDLLYIIFFCHTQLTVTLLLCLIFGSKAYVVFRGGGKEDAVGKLQGTTGKFIGKSCRTQGTSNQTNSISLQQGNFTEEADGVTEEFRRLYAQLELLKEKNMRLGNRHLVTKIQAMQEAASRSETHVSTIQAISSSMRLSTEPSSSKTIEETEVGARNDDKSVSVYHHHHLQDSVESATRNKGGKKKSLEYKIVSTEKAEKLKEPEGKENGNIENSRKRDEDPEVGKDTDDKELFKSNGNENEDKANHQVALDAVEEVASSEVVAVVASGQNVKNLSSSDNGEAGGLVESSSTRINEVAAGNGSGSTSGTSSGKERGKNKSGHARTHAIVINLDDKSRFSEEVTV